MSSRHCASIEAIKSGEATIENAFAPLDTRAPQAKAPHGKPTTEAPKAKGKDKPKGAAPAAAAKPATAKKTGEVVAPADAVKMEDALHAEGIPEKEFCKKFGIAQIVEPPIEQLEAAKQWIKSVSEG
jgi:hypothetical protein